MTERTYYVVEFFDGEAWSQVEIGSYRIENQHVADIVARAVSSALGSIRNLVHDNLGIIKVIKVEEKRTIVDQSYRVQG